MTTTLEFKHKYVRNYLFLVTASNSNVNLG